FVNLPLLVKSGEKKITIIAFAGASGDTVEKLFRQGATKKGLDAAVVRMDPTTVDYTPIITKVRQTNPDVWSVATSPAQTAGLLQAAVDNGFQKPMLVSGG